MFDFLIAKDRTVNKEPMREPILSQSDSESCQLLLQLLVSNGSGFQRFMHDRMKLMVDTNDAEMCYCGSPGVMDVYITISMYLDNLAGECATRRSTLVWLHRWEPLGTHLPTRSQRAVFCPWFD
jgi:hypothetical protein